MLILRPSLLAAVALWLVFLSSLAFPAADAETFVGTVKMAQGRALVRRGVDTAPIREGMQLFLNDVLETSADGRVGVILEDGTRIALGPNTELKVDRFVYRPVEGKFAMVLRLGRGVFAYVSGRIAHFSPESVSVETPIGILGLRGTNFAVSIEGG
jgi:hypothetical protein